MPACIFSVYSQSFLTESRTLPAEELARTVSMYCARVSAEESTEQAVRKALAEAESEDVILAFGSLSYLGQVKEAVDKLDEGSSSGLEKKRGRKNDRQEKIEQAGAPSAGRNWRRCGP